MVEPMGLRKWRRGHIQWYDFSAKLHENIPVSSKVIKRTDRQPDRENGDTVSLAFLL